MTLDDLAALTDELLAPERLSAAGVGTDEDVFRSAIEPLVVGRRDAGLGVSRCASPWPAPRGGWDRRSAPPSRARTTWS